MTEENQDNAPDRAASGKKTYTPEEKAEILRRLRRGTLIMGLLIGLIAVLGVGMIYIQTQDVVITGLAAAGVAGYFIYTAIKGRNTGNK